MAVLKMELLNAEKKTLASSKRGQQVSIVYTSPYADGDFILLEADTPDIFCMIQLEDSMPPALVYLPERRLIFRIPPADSRASYSPKSFIGSCHLLRARLATEEEVSARRNLAFNPYDASEGSGAYPHVSANVETRGEAAFAVRNTIDGVFENCSHGKWPYQSWGINKDPNAALKLEFGRPVVIDEIRLTLRADFPHDSWWTSATVSFSDGSQEVMALEKTASAQAFTIAKRTVEWLELRELKKAPDESPFPSLTQIEAFGREIGRKD